MARKDNLVKAGSRTRFDWPVQPDAVGRSVETVRVDGLPNTKAGEIQAALASYDTTAHPSDPRQLLYNARPRWVGNGRWIVDKFYRTPPETGGGGGATQAAPVQFDSWYTYRYQSWFSAGGFLLESEIPRVVESVVARVSIYAGELDQSPYSQIVPLIGKVNADTLNIYGTDFPKWTVRVLPPRIVVLLAANGGFRYRTTYSLALATEKSLHPDKQNGEAQGFIEEFREPDFLDKPKPTDESHVGVRNAYPTVAASAIANLPFFNA